MYWRKKDLEACARCGSLFYRTYGKPIKATQTDFDGHIASGEQIVTRTVWYCQAHAPAYDRRDDTQNPPTYYLDVVKCDHMGRPI
jgi:hypothetical protein